MALPSNVSYTKITGRFLKAVTDTLADPDQYPDGSPFVGLTIVFTPAISPPRVKNVNATPPVTMIIDPVSATTDAEGDIVSPSGTKGVWLVSTDDPDLIPNGWTYSVKITGTGFPTVEFSFVAQSGGEFDIATMVPVPSNPGAALLEWQAAVAETDANADRAEAAATDAEVAAEAAENAAASVADGESAYEIAVANGFVGTEVEWLDSLEGAPGAPGAPGRYVYADSAEFLADTQTRDGYIAAPTGANWQADLGSPIPTNYVGPILTTTQTMTVSGTVVTTQWVYFGSSSTYLTGLFYSRRKSGAGAWSTWSSALYGSTTPTGNYELASKYYVDSKGVSNLSEAEFNALTDGTVAHGKVNIIDFATFTGIAEFEGGGVVWFEHEFAWTEGVGDVWGAWYQKLHVPDTRAGGTGSPLVVERHRLYVGSAWGAWSAWAIEEAPEPTPSGTYKAYTSTAEIDNVTTTEYGIYRFPAGTQDEFFGAAGAQLQWWASDVLFTSVLTDNYGTGFPPTGSGTIQQKAEVFDGYGTRYQLNRYRLYNSGTGVWGTWSAWSLPPLPLARPGSTGLWTGTSNVDGSGDGWSTMYTPTSTTIEGDSTHTNVAQNWGVWFNNASRAAMEGGELVFKSASFEFQGILDATRTDVGTVGYSARTSGVSMQTSRVSATAATSAAGEIAGFSIPLGIFTRPGIIFHATFSMESGITADTRLLCGLVSTADLATAMTDVDPASMQNFFAAGYGSSDTNVSVFQKGTGSMTTSASTQAVSTSNNQIIDIKAMYTPNGSGLRFILSVRTTSTIVRATASIGNTPSNTTPLNFFIRASAGATAAQPKVGLHRLRLGTGLGSLGGS